MYMSALACMFIYRLGVLEHFLHLESLTTVMVVR
jgi:hypothetical protein